MYVLLGRIEAASALFRWLVAARAACSWGDMCGSPSVRVSASATAAHDIGTLNVDPRLEWDARGSVLAAIVGMVRQIPGCGIPAVAVRQLVPCVAVALHHVYELGVLLERTLRATRVEARPGIGIIRKDLRIRVGEDYGPMGVCALHHRGQL